jgi:hypothetical protein
MRTVRRALVLLAATSTVAKAQISKTPQVSKLPSAAGSQACTMVDRVLMMQVVDANGVPIADATIAVKNLRTRAVNERADALGSGDYRIFDDSGVKSVTRAGDPFDVLFTYGTRMRHVRVNIGTDPDGCHVRFVTVPQKVVL